MPKRSGNKKDINKLGHSIIDQATNDKVKDPIAVELGRRGGLKGGKQRSVNLSKEELSDIGKLGAIARWKGHKKKKN